MSTKLWDFLQLSMGLFSPAENKAGASDGALSVTPFAGQIVQ
jgi:hypothetical protein